jgi:hypothetical protein
VKVDLRSVRRSWKDSGYGELWIQFRTRTASADGFSVALDATIEQDGGEGVSVQFATETPEGFVIELDRVVDDEHLGAWLDGFAVRLRQAGFTGTLRGTSSLQAPPQLQWWGRPKVATAFIGWAFDLAAMTADPYRDTGWHLGPDATAGICDHLAAWVEPGGPDVVVRRQTYRFAVGAGADISGILAAALVAGRRPGVTRTGGRHQGARTIAMSYGAETALQVVDGPSRRWEPRIGELRDAITALPELTNQAFVRPARPGTRTWPRVAGGPPRPGSKERNLRHNRHLLDRYVPDAHGIQVVRDAHLANAHDLSRWTVTDLGHGRHLVEAPDLAPWYADRLPDPGTVARARHDFGAMILTPDAVRANPPPWEPGGAPGYRLVSSRPGARGGS